MSQTTVLHVGGLHWATSERAIETTLLRQRGVSEVEANAVNQSATMTYDPEVTSVAELFRMGARLRLPLRRALRSQSRMRADGRSRPPIRRPLRLSRHPAYPRGRPRGARRAFAG